MIISLLSDARWRLVDSVSISGTRHKRVADGRAMVAALRQYSYLHAIVDPSLAEDIPFDLLVSAAGVTPLLLFGDLTIQAVDTCFTAQAIRPINALFADTVDRNWVRSVLRDYTGIDVQARVLDGARGAIACLPVRIRLPTVALFTGWRVASSTRVFSCKAGIPRKAVQRWYSRVGLAYPARVLTVARLARAWRLLRSQHFSVSRTADLVGFGSARTLVRACWTIAHCAPANVREHSDEEFAGHLVRAIAPGMIVGGGYVPPLLQKEIHL